MTSEIESVTPVQGELNSPGKALAQLRESQHLSIIDVAQRLKYGVRQIEALEQDDFSKLSGATFVRGMIRSYAKLLGADPEPMLQQFVRQHIPGPMTVDLRAKKIPFPDRTKRATRIYGVLSLLTIVLAGLVGYELYSGASLLAGLEEKYSQQQPVQQQPLQQQAAASTDVQTTPERRPSESKNPPGAEVVTIDRVVVGEEKKLIPPVNMAAGRKRIALQFDRESWVEIKQADGKTLLSQLNPAGTRQFVEGVPPFLLTIGNAPNVHVQYNDQPVDLRPHFKIDVARLTLE